jgi:hypothetical protein
MAALISPRVFITFFNVCDLNSANLAQASTGTKRKRGSAGFRAISKHATTARTAETSVNGISLLFADLCARI